MSLFMARYETRTRLPVSLWKHPRSGGLKLHRLVVLLLIVSTAILPCTASVVIGVSTRDGIVIAADKLATLDGNRTFEKYNNLCPAGPHCVVGAVGKIKNPGKHRYFAFNGLLASKTVIALQTSTSLIPNAQQISNEMI